MPGELQSFSADQVNAQHGATVLDALGSQTAGVSLSDSQGNTMFQDLRFHGFEASPLQGVAQGVAVYQNGVRLNEAFGDTVNWDAIPETAIARMDVWSTNPVFGLNALGGSVNLVMKNGFTWQGTELSGQGGTYGHGMGTAQYGVERRQSELLWRGGRRDRQRLAAAFRRPAWRGSIPIPAGASAPANCISSRRARCPDLGVVGPTPIELLQQASTAVYTYPQTTHNLIGSLALNDKTRLSDNWQLEASRLCARAAPAPCRRQ